MNFTAEDVKKLREATGAGFADCRNALTEASSFDAAIKVLEAKGQERAEMVKGKDRATSEGTIASYIHGGGRVGVLLELNCSTDFVARNEEFRTLARELAIQVAGLDPQYISFADIPAEILDAARQEVAQDPEVLKKPERVREQIIEGKIKKQFGPKVLLEQPWVKDETKTIGTLIDDAIRKTGENIVVRRFTRYVLGE
jgi:elongation factor Ts